MAVCFEADRQESFLEAKPAGHPLCFQLAKKNPHLGLILLTISNEPSFKDGVLTLLKLPIFEAMGCH